MDTQKGTGYMIGYIMRVNVMAMRRIPRRDMTNTSTVKIMMLNINVLIKQQHVVTFCIFFYDLRLCSREFKKNNNKISNKTVNKKY